MTQLWENSQKRHHQRIALEVEVIVVTNAPMLPGRTHDISEAGMAAILPVELHEGADVEVQIKLPSGTQTVHAIVRHRNVYRHGFEFVQPLVGSSGNDAEFLKPNCHVSRKKMSRRLRGGMELGVIFDPKVTHLQFSAD